MSIKLVLVSKICVCVCVSKNMGTPKWMVYNEKILLKLVIPLFLGKHPYASKPRGFLAKRFQGCRFGPVYPSRRAW